MNGHVSELPVAAESLSVSIEDNRILEDLSFQIRAGQCVGLLGPNGSGKTTLLRAVGGLLPYKGRIHLYGTEVSRWKPRNIARQIAFVRQHTSLEFDFTVEEFVSLGLSPHKKLLQGKSRSDHEHVISALKQMNMLAFTSRSMQTLSGGEMQRVFMAQALVQRSNILLLDEPTAHLDVHFQFELLQHVKDLTAQGKTAIAVFHDLPFASRFADTLLILNEGLLVAAGSPSEVLTERLVAEVFRMHATITPADDGSLNIHYIAPVRDAAIALT